mgnify:CR=1 FL=1
MAQGDWVSITATEGIDYTVTLGFKKLTETETQAQQSYELSMQMTSGISLKVLNESETISESYSEAISVDAKSSFAYGEKDTITL